MATNTTPQSKKATKPSQWCDGLLLERVLDGHEAAWVELLHRFRSLVYRCITKVTVKHAPDISVADLDEIYADVLMNLLRDDKRKLRMYDPRKGTKLSSWIGMISINSAYDFLRSASRRPMLDKLDLTPEHSEGESERSPLDRLIEKERWSHLNELLADFSTKDRHFVSLYYDQGLDADRVAQEMAISLKTVYSKKHKIREHLKRCVASAGQTSALSDLAIAA